MNVSNKYFDVIIKNNTFYIVEHSSKQKKHHSAISTLNKIEKIIKNNLNYSDDHLDNYSSLSKIKLWKILKAKSTEIHHGYTQKQSKLNWFVRKIFSRGKKVNAIHERIKNFIPPPPVFPLPNELIQGITDHLSLSDLSAFARLNHNGNEHATASMDRLARKFGYEGPYSEGSKYLKDLFKEINQVWRIKKLLPPECIVYKKAKNGGDSIDPIKTLQNLKTLQSKYILPILANKFFYTSAFQKFRKIFNVNGNWPLSEPSDSLKKIGNKALVLAVKHGEKEIVKLLLRYGIDLAINATDKYGNTALSTAIFFDNKLEFIQFLIDEGADVNIANAAGITPLILSNSSEMTHLLLEAGATATIDNESKEGTALHIAASEGSLEIIKSLVEHGATVNARRQDGCTALYIAVVRGHKEIVAYLISKQADVNTVNIRGNTPLIHSKSPEITLLLLESGAIATIDLLSLQPEVGNALHRATREGELEIVKLLIQRGANINIENLQDLTALDLAVINKNTEIVKFLISQNADVNRVNTRGVTPLIYSNSLEITRLLLEAGATATINHVSDRGSALHRAAPMGDLKMIKFLIQHGANIHIESLQGLTALDLAVMYGITNVVKFLIRKNVDVNRVNAQGDTPLTLSFSSEITRLLLKAGASSTINHQSNTGTALHRAVSSSIPKIKIIKLLAKYGADMNAKDSHGNTALDLAKQHNYKKIERLLSSLGATV